MPSNRRLHQCRHDGCTSQSKWQLLLQLRCTHVADWNRQAFMLKMPSTLMVCDKHTQPAIELATNDHAKNQIRAMCFREGYGWPDFGSMVAMFAPVDHATVEGQLQ